MVYAIDKHESCVYKAARSAEILAFHCIPQQLQWISEVEQVSGKPAGITPVHVYTWVCFDCMCIWILKNRVSSITKTCIRNQDKISGMKNTGTSIYLIPGVWKNCLGIKIICTRHT